jgi:hypothetical protein
MISNHGSLVLFTGFVRWFRSLVHWFKFTQQGSLECSEIPRVLLIWFDGVGSTCVETPFAESKSFRQDRHGFKIMRSGHVQDSVM